MCSIVKLMEGTTDERIMPSTASGLRSWYKSRLVSFSPSSSLVAAMSVFSRQYCTISVPENSAVLILVLPMSRVRIIRVFSPFPWRQARCTFCRASVMGVTRMAATTASQPPAIRPMPAMSVSTDAASSPVST